ncbi:MAG: GNAT family N-acetyltransferase [Planctomycetes bacterium]|nr:GNAT family N-acetyltransferase [Planctomycetota bacterium]
MSSSPPIVRVPPQELPSALKSLVMFGRRQTAVTIRSFIAYAEAANMDLDQCWAMQQEDGRLHPVCLALPSPGATAMVFASDVGSAKNIDVFEQGVRVLRHALRHMDTSRIHLAQALIARSEKGTGKLLQDSGFEWLAGLSYLERRIGSKDRAPIGSSHHDDRLDSFVFEPHDGTGSDGNESDFSRVIEASYEQTLDCPGLRGARTMREVMEGHKATGYFRPDLWTLARCASSNKPAGVLLLNPLTPLDSEPADEHDEDGDVIAELVYLGIHPDFRQRGLARRLLEIGIGKLAATQRITKLVLAVDEVNEPARHLYKSFSFYRTDRRIAYIYPLAHRVAVNDRMDSPGSECAS